MMIPGHTRFTPPQCTNNAYCHLILRVLIFLKNLRQSSLLWSIRVVDGVSPGILLFIIYIFRTLH
jgi:hypothetical protein